MTETLQIKITPEHDAAHDDDLGRTTNGHYPGIPADLGRIAPGTLSARYDGQTWHASRGTRSAAAGSTQGGDALE